MPNSVAAASAPDQVSQNASNSAAAAISSPDTVTSILRRPRRSEMIPPTIEATTTPPV